MAGRRSTLASIDGNAPFSSIPVPSSAVKKVGGGFGASSSQHGYAHPHPPHRMSIAPGLGTSQGRGTDVGYLGGGVGRQSQSRQSLAPTPNVRRQSTFPTGRQSQIGAPSSHMSMGGGGGGLSAMKETRPVRDRQFQAQMQRNILAFMEERHHGLPNVNPKQLAQPTQTTFIQLFKFLYVEAIDPNYRFGAEGKKFEEEALQILKDVKYPLADNISKTQLQSAGSQHNWPSMLAMLNWFVEIATVEERRNPNGSGGPLPRLANYEDADAEAEDSMDVDGEEQAKDDPDAAADKRTRLFWPYLWRCYSRFWQGEDAYPEEQSELNDQFARKNEGMHKEIQELEKEHEKLVKELAAFESVMSPLQKQQEEANALEKDVRKFHQYTTEIVEPRVEKTRRTVARLKEAYEDKEAELREITAERARIQDIVDHQETSADEVERMMSEQRRLAKELSELAPVVETARKLAWDREIAEQRRKGDLEKLFAEFNDKAHSVRLFEFDRSLPGELEIWSGSDNLLQPGVDLKGVLRPAIVRLRQEKNAEFIEREDESIALSERLQNLVEEVEARREEVEAREARLRALGEQLDETKEAIAVESASMNASAENIERELLATKNAGQMQLLHYTNRAQALEVEHQTLQERATSKREEVNSEVIKILQEILGAKLHVQSGLNELLQVAKEA